MISKLKPLLVVSYIDETRAALMATLAASGANAVACSTFCEAENLALIGLYSGLLIDLPSIIKAKGEEKIVAYTLTNFFPTLRVRTMGSMLVPMSMPGGARQEKSLADFLAKGCMDFTPRQLRIYRRHPVCIPTLIKCSGGEFKGFTLDLSWGGGFIIDVASERFAGERDITVLFPDCAIDLEASIRWSRPWGERFAPGIGIQIKNISEKAKIMFSGLFKSSIEFDRDRLIS